MYKSKEKKNIRKEFIKLSVNNWGKAGDVIIEKGERLKRAKDSADAVKILSEILFLNHCTIYRDCAR